MSQQTWFIYRDECHNSCVLCWMVTVKSFWVFAIKAFIITIVRICTCKSYTLYCITCSVSWIGLQYVIVVFPYHVQLLFASYLNGFVCGVLLSWYLFCYAVLCVLSIFLIISQRKRKLVTLFCVSSSWCRWLVCSVWLWYFLIIPT